MPDRNWWATLWPDPKSVLQKLGLEPEMTAIDLCCGDGYFTEPLAKLVRGNLFAIDLDSHLLEEARVAVEGNGATVRQWICGDVRELAKLVPEKVDFVLLANTFHGVPDKLALARSVETALHPGGHFTIVNWHPLPREETIVLEQPRGPRTELRMSTEQVQDIVEAAGLSLERIAELPPYHYGAIFRKSRRGPQKYFELDP